MNISFIGLGKLGLCSAACFASKGHKVIGVDSNVDFIAVLKSKKCPIKETGLESLLEQAWENLLCTTDYAYAVANSDITMIIVPTPSKSDGTFSNQYIEKVLYQIAPALACKKEFHIINIVSTVMPASCDNIFIPLLEKLSNKKCNSDFGFAYNPEFIALGSVIQNFLNPDMVLIGSSNDYTAQILKKIYLSTVDSQPFYALMSLVNAEITKLSLNCYVTMKISFANELTALCEGIQGADVDVITKALGADSRVGQKYLTGGLGFGGPCFPRDNQAFQKIKLNNDYKIKLSPKVIEINNSIPKRIFKYIEKQLPKNSIVTLFGMSYKQDTYIIEESQSLILAELLAENYVLRIYDPMALKAVQLELENIADNIQYFDNPYKAVVGANGLILLTNWKEFILYDWAEIENKLADKAFIIDSWRILKDVKFKQISYLPLGIGK